MEYFMGDSECSSGCESGWTLYLDNSFVSPYDGGDDNGNGDYKGKCGFSSEKRTGEEEEDMSMVSDASSGPPHFPEEEEEDATLFKNRAKKQKLREHRKKQQVFFDKPSLLDDTASSPVFNLPNKTTKNHHGSSEALLDVSKGYSTTQFEGRASGYQEQHGFFRYSSPSANYLQQNQWFAGRTWQQ